MPGWLMLTVIWDLSWGCQPDHLHMASTYGLNFLTACESHNNGASYMVDQGSMQFFQLTKLKLYHLLRLVIGRLIMFHQLQCLVTSKTKSTQIKGERKCTLPLRGKGIKIIFRHVFKPSHWALLCNCGNQGLKLTAPSPSLCMLTSLASFFLTVDWLQPESREKTSRNTQHKHDPWRSLFIFLGHCQKGDSLYEISSIPKQPLQHLLSSMLS